MKKCKVCLVPFEPKNSMQKVCSLNCAIIFAKKDSKVKEQKEWNKRKAKVKEEVKSISEYRSELQKLVNKIARLIDRGFPCISSGRRALSYDGGHFYSTSASPQIRFNLLNIYAQSVHDNRDKHGNLIEYRKGLINEFGEDFMNELDSLPLIHEKAIRNATKEDYKNWIANAKQVVKELNKREEQFTSSERIEYRRFYNIKIGIYV